MRLKVVLLCFCLSVVIKPISDLLFGQLHLTEELAKEYKINTPAKHGVVIVTGTEQIKYFSPRPQFYFYANARVILTMFFVSLVASFASISIARRCNASI